MTMRCIMVLVAVVFTTVYMQTAPPTITSTYDKFYYMSPTESRIFSCFVTGLIPNISWGYKQSKDIELGVYYNVDNQSQTTDLVVGVQQGIEQGLYGTYTCRATNAYGSSEVSFDILRSSPPTITNTLDDVYFMFPTETRTFECNVAGKPMPNVSWTYSQSNEIELGVYYFVDNQTNNLIVGLQQGREQGMYGTFTCRAMNAYGSSEVSFDILRSNPITFRIVPPPETMLLIRNSSSLYINASQQIPRQTIMYSWSFIDTQNKFYGQHYLSESKYYHFQNNNKELIINATSLDATSVVSVLGTYIATARNEYESKEHTSVVISDASINPATLALNFQKDLIFVVDGSLAMEKHFNQSIRFMIDIAKEGDVDGGKLRVGLVVFTDKSEVQFYLNNYTTFDDIVNSVKETEKKFPVSRTARNTASALKVTREEMFHVGFGGRSNAPDEVILITGGKSNVNPEQTLAEARATRAAGVHVTTLGLSLINQEEIDEICKIAGVSGQCYIGEDPNTFKDAIIHVVYRGVPVSRVADNTTVVIISITLSLLTAFIGTVGAVYAWKRYNIKKYELPISKIIRKKNRDKGILSDKGMHLLTTNLGSDLHRFVIYLGVERRDIEVIQSMFNATDSRRNDGLIIKWKHDRRLKVTNNNTNDEDMSKIMISEIVDALNEIGRQDIIQVINKEYNLSSEIGNENNIFQLSPADIALELK